MDGVLNRTCCLPKQKFNVYAISFGNCWEGERNNFDHRISVASNYNIFIFSVNISTFWMMAFHVQMIFSL